MDTRKAPTEDRLDCVFCHRHMSETAFLRRKVASRQISTANRRYQAFYLDKPNQNNNNCLI